MLVPSVRNLVASDLLLFDAPDTLLQLGDAVEVLCHLWSAHVTHVVRHVCQALAALHHGRRRLRVLVPDPVQAGGRCERRTAQEPNERTREWALL